eukprot:4004857-Amphidinium_carterae.1
MVPIACAIVSSHLRVHFDTTMRPAEGWFVLLAHMWMLEAFAGFHRRHETRVVTSCHHVAPRHGSGKSQRLARIFAHVSDVHSLWFLVCTLVSAPAVLYSAVKAVPGFLQVSGFWRWLVSNAV